MFLCPGLTKRLFAGCPSAAGGAPEDDMKKILCVAITLFLLCSQPVWADIHILTINDFHGWVEENGSSPGMAKLAAFIKDYRLTHSDTIVVSGGDNYQGEALSNLTLGDLVNALYGLIGLRFSAVGNHEFDWGTEHFDRWNVSGVQYLGANIVERRTGQAPSWIKPYAIVQTGGRKVAFIGLSTRETEGTTAPKHLTGLQVEPAAAAAARWVAYLKQGRDEHGVPDAIVLLTHVPSFQDPASGIIFGDEVSELTRLKGVDAVITGHSHRKVSGRHDGVPVVQAACFGKAVGVLRLVFEGSRLAGITPEVIDLKSLAGSLKTDPQVLSVTQSYRKRMSGLIDRPVCRLKGDLPFERSRVEQLTPLGYLICKAIQTQTGAQVTLVNNGSIRRGLKAGVVTYGHIMGMFPFDDYIVSMRMSGKDLTSLIMAASEGKGMRSCQFAGVRLRVRPRAGGSPRIEAVELENGEAIRDEGYYSVAVPDYIFEGGDGHNFAVAQDPRYIYVQMRDMLVEYLEARRVVDVPDISSVYRTVRTQHRMRPGNAQRETFMERF